MDEAFGSSPFALGIEEELLLVTATPPHGLDHRASELVARMSSPSVKPDVYEAMVESATAICTGAAQAVDELARRRAALGAAGFTLAGAGVHPEAAFGDVVHVHRPRYEQIRETMRGLLERTPTCALHVHVGMPDAETAIATCNRLRAHLPLFQALAAHSPYWHGRDSGFATARAQLFRGYPRAVVPRAFAGWEDYVESTRAWMAAAEIDDYTFLWWDLRPHPRLGTVEVRAMDAQSRIRAVLGLAALVHALAVACADGQGEIETAEAITESSFRAGRDGLDAHIWWRGANRPLREVAREALDVARPYAEDLGEADALHEVERILAEGNGADRMRAAHRRGGMRAVLELLARETAGYGSTQTTSPIRTHR